MKGRRRKGEKKNSGDRKTEKPRNRKEKSKDGEGHVGYEGRQLKAEQDPVLPS